MRQRVFLALAPLLALAACGPKSGDSPAAPVAGASLQPARIEPLTASAADMTRFCTADGAWCVVQPAEQLASVQHIIKGAPQAVATLAEAKSEEVESHAPWPSIVRQTQADGAETVIVGVVGTYQTAYSGGGGSADHVALYVLGSATSAEPIAPAFVAPSSGSLDIRACFSEKDVKARFDACSDQYNFAGKLAVAPGAAGWPPKLTLTTEASTYPGKLSRDADSLENPPRSAADLKTVRDETCSYTRTLAFDAASGKYAPDQPLPPCEDYLKP